MDFSLLMALEFLPEICPMVFGARERGNSCELKLSGKYQDG